MEVIPFELEPYDIICSRGSGWISRAIMKSQKRKTGGSRVSHVAIGVGNVLGEDQVIEALWQVKRHQAKKYYGQKIVIYRNRILTLAERYAIMLTACKLEDKRYPVGKIALFWLDHTFKTDFFSGRVGFLQRQVCSGLAAWAPFETFSKYPESHLQEMVTKSPYLEKLARNKIFGWPWKVVTPDDIDDYCQGHPEEWQEIYNSIE